MINKCFFYLTVALAVMLTTVNNNLFAQTGDIQELRQDILELRADVDHINLNLEKSKSKFQKGIFIATLGYSITIAGGLLLSTNDVDAGRALLITGGVTGGIGTYMLVDAFKFLGRTRRSQK